MMWRCRILGHDGPYWLDFNHQGHCRRCREPHPQWIRMQEIDAIWGDARSRRELSTDE